MPAPGRDLGAFNDTVGNIARDAIGLFAIDQRPKVGLWVETMAKLQLRCLLGQTIDQLFIDRAMRVDPRSGDADLPGVRKYASGNAGNR